MIFSAGLGTRLGSKTATRPKALVEVNGKTLLERNLSFLYTQGYRRFVINVHHFAHQIEEFLSKMEFPGAEMFISDERKQILETGGGLVKAYHEFPFEGDWLLVNVDILSNINLDDLYRFHLEKKNEVTLVVRKRESSRYFLFDEEKVLSGWENIKSGDQIITRKSEHLNRLAFSGISMVSNSFIRSIRQEGKFSIVKAFLDASERNKVLAFTDDHSYWFDVGTPEKLFAAECFLKDHQIL